MGGAPASAGEPPLLPVGARTRPVGPPMGCGWKPGVPASAICFTNKFQIFIKGTHFASARSKGTKFSCRLGAPGAPGGKAKG